MNFLPWFRFQASGKAFLSYALALAGSCVLLCLIGHSTGWSEEDPGGGPDPWMDSDGDGITDEDEWHLYYTDPYSWDTDGDGYGDYEEIFHYGTNPNDPGSYPMAGPPDYQPGVDSDGDGLDDYEEYYLYGTDPYSWDTDGDGYGDYEEIFHYGTNPNDPGSYPMAGPDPDPDPDPNGEGGEGSGTEIPAPLAQWLASYQLPVDPGTLLEDPDEDGLTNQEEFQAGTHPLMVDTDGDGLSNVEEFTIAPIPSSGTPMETACPTGRKSTDSSKPSTMVFGSRDRTTSTIPIPAITSGWTTNTGTACPTK